MASKGVTDMSGKKSELQGDDWIPGLAEPGAVDGKQFGVQFYAANRVVIYRTDLFGDPEIQAGLKDLYGHVDRIEFYPGLFAEDTRPNSVLPALIGRLVGVAV